MTAPVEHVPDGRRMIAAGLVEVTPSGPRIVVGRRPDGSLVFPMPGEDAAECERALLGPTGTLWSWTVQRFRPKSPPYVAAEGAFAPFFVGYVEFPEGIIIEGRILARVGRDDLCVGMPMEVTVIAVCADASGAPLHLFAFRPVAAGP